jgi:hypothetical protein
MGLSIKTGNIEHLKNVPAACLSSIIEPKTAISASMACGGSF